MNADQLAQYMASGASGSNPYVEAKLNLKLQKFLKGEVVPGAPEHLETTPGQNVELPGPLQPGVGGENAQGSRALMGRTPDTQHLASATPDKYVPGVEQLAQGYEQQRNAELAQNLFDKNQGRGGGSVNVNGNGVQIGAKEFNPYAAQQAGTKQAQAFLKTAQGAYKGINDQLDAAQSTIDALNQGNAASDKIALINEARIAAGQGGSRAIAHLVDLLSGGQTAAGTFQDKLNWLQNTPNIPTLQPAQRDAIREATFGRLGQLDQQHQKAAAQLAQQGPIVAPQADTATLINSFSGPTEQKLQGLKRMQADYSSQRAKMGPSPVSQPTTANANPTTLDRLKSFFSLGHSSGNAAPQAQAQPDDPIAAELAKRAAGSLNKSQGQ